MRMLRQTTLTRLPVLKIKNESYDRYLGENIHDMYVLGKDGGLHYLNIQGMYGTEHDELEFDVEEDEYWGKIFESWDFIELMEHDAKRLGIEENEEYKKIKNKLDEIFDNALERKEDSRDELIIKMIKEYEDKYEY